MRGLLRHLFEDAELEYERHPRAIFISALLGACLLIILQSYFALPRNLVTVILDTWEVPASLLPLALVVYRLKIRNLLIFGALYFIAGVSVAFFRFPHFVKIEYATIFFLAGIWLIGDWFNYKKFKTSIISQLLKGDYRLAMGLFISTVVLGSFVELLNIPSKLWWYKFPFPSIEVYGLPIFIVGLGWFPWITAMLVFLYPFAAGKTPSIRQKRSRQLETQRKRKTSKTK